ncbi:MAG: hypothetical protein K9M82_05965, partial [Deltaproteobacteria bacterium]|nr:hypothetical protein [Deltaproteobacteria bacterium]
VELPREALSALARGEELPLKRDVENGYVILTLDGEPLGLGLLIDGMLRSQIPRSELRFFLIRPGEHAAHSFRFEKEEPCL